MSDQRKEFEARTERLISKRRSAQRAAQTAFIDSDGYVIIRAKPRARPIPFLGVAILALGFVALKGFMIAQLGQQGYGARIQALFGDMPLTSKIGAWAMQDGLVSNLVAQGFERLL